MKGGKNQHSSVQKWLSETKCLLCTLVVLFIFTTDVASNTDCSIDYRNSPLTIDCVYIQAEGILCTWNWKNFSTVSLQGEQSITATMVLNNSIGILSQSCIDQEVNTTCRFQNHFDTTTLFSVLAIVNNPRSAEVYEACKKYNLLSTVRYEKPGNVAFHHSYFDGWITDVVWQFPSDYPSSQGVLRTWSVCKVRWSKNLGPWDDQKVTSYFLSLRNVDPSSTYNVQVTCMCVYSNKENWTPNYTFTIQPAQTDEINHDLPSYVTSARATRTSFLFMPDATRPSSQEQASEQSAPPSSTRSRDTIINLPTTTKATSIKVTVPVMLKGSAAPLALGVIGAIVLLSAILVGGFILTYRYRKTLEKGNSPPRVEEDLNGQVAGISRWVSKEKLLDNASLGNCRGNSKESAL